jgi:hypothetical protein
MEESDLFKTLVFPADQEILILNVPADVMIPKRAVTKISSLKGRCRFAAVFTLSQEELRKMLPDIAEITDENTNLWICYPKKSSSLNSDLSREFVWKIMQPLGLGPASQKSVDATWSALRFKLASVIVRKAPFVSLYIDFTNRIVTLPDDVKVVLDADHLVDVFSKMSFTHKKEYIEAIIEAKKLETRGKRIRQMVEILKSKK